MLAHQIRLRTMSPAGLVTAVSSVVALCIMGDSLMYSILPLEAPALGFSLPLVGVLLSANRFIRLLSNRWAGAAFERYGPGKPFLIAVVIGLISTVVYGFSPVFMIFLGARIAWGIAWSGLRQGGFVSTWAGNPAQRGRLTGLLLGVIRLGSAVGVVFGGALYDRYGFSLTIAVVAGVGLLAIPLAMLIPWPSAASHQSDTTTSQAASRQPEGWRLFMRFALERPLHRWLTLSGFFIYMLSGVVVSTTSIFIASRISGASDVVILGIGVATLSGLLHGIRWTTNLLVGPFVGALSDSIGKANTLIALGLLMVVAIVSVNALPIAGAILALMLILILDGSITVVINATATTIATETGRPHSFVAAFATSADAGSAFGPVIAFSALANTRLPIVYLTVGLILFVFLALFWRADHSRPSASTTQA